MSNMYNVLYGFSLRKINPKEINLFTTLKTKIGSSSIYEDWTTGACVEKKKTSIKTRGTLEEVIFPLRYPLFYRCFFFLHTIPRDWICTQSHVNVYYKKYNQINYVNSEMCCSCTSRFEHELVVNVWRIMYELTKICYLFDSQRA